MSPFTELLVVGFGTAAGWLALFALCYGARSSSASLLRRYGQGAFVAACAVACRFPFTDEHHLATELGIWLICSALAATRAPASEAGE